MLECLLLCSLNISTCANLCFSPSLSILFCFSPPPASGDSAAYR